MPMPVFQFVSRIVKASLYKARLVELQLAKKTGAGEGFQPRSKGYGMHGRAVF